MRVAGPDIAYEDSCKESTKASGLDSLKDMLETMAAASMFPFGCVAVHSTLNGI